MNFTVMDVETANSHLAICQIGLVRFEDGRERSAERIFVDCGEVFEEFHVSIHGITPERCRGAMDVPSALAWVWDRVGDGLIASYSEFDKNAIARASEPRALTNPWLDIARVARAAWPEHPDGHRLPAIARTLGIQFNHHDALEDARAAGLVLLEASRAKGFTLEDWLALIDQDVQVKAEKRKARTRAHFGGFDAKRTGGDSGPLAGEVVVITGNFSRSREEIADLIHNAGGAVANTVTKKTTVVVAGGMNDPRFRGKSSSGKLAKAQELIEKGQPIRLLSESEVLALVSQPASVV